MHRCDLIWDSPASTDGRAAVMVPGDSLATVLVAAEACAAGHHSDVGPDAELLDVIADPRAALTATTTVARTANETN